MSNTISGQIVAGALVAYENPTSGASVNVGERKQMKIRETADAPNDVIEVDSCVGTQVPRTLSSGDSELLDMFDLGGFDVGAGAGRDNLGVAENCDELVYLQITTELFDEDDVTPLTGNLLVGGEGSAACWDSLFNGDPDAVIKLPPGSQFQVACAYATAWAIVDGTNHLLKFAASGAKVRYRVTFGRRAA